LLSRLWLAMPGEPARSSSPSDSIEAVELCHRIPTQGRRQFVGKRFARVVDCLEHIAEEIEDLGKSERDTVRSQIRRIIGHFLKLAYSGSEQPRVGWIESVVRA
jgi:hypothetical protein